MINYEGIAKSNGGVIVISDPRKGPFKEHEEGCGAVLISGGSVQWESNRTRNYVNGPNLIVFGHNNSLDDLSMSDDFSGYLLLVSSDFINTMKIDLSRSKIVEALIDGPIIKHLRSNELSIYRGYFELLYNNIKETEEDDGAEITQYLAKALYYKVLSTLYVSKKDDTHNQNERILKRYLKLVYKHGFMHRDLAFYANILCITPKYLSAAVSKASGKKASQWLSEATMNKAKYILKETNMPISQISEALLFQTPSEFIRYFSNHEGITPLKYRNM